MNKKDLGDLSIEKHRNIQIELKKIDIEIIQNIRRKKLIIFFISLFCFAYFIFFLSIIAAVILACLIITSVFNFNLEIKYQGLIFFLLLIYAFVFLLIIVLSGGRSYFYFPLCSLSYQIRMYSDNVDYGQKKLLNLIDKKNKVKFKRIRNINKKNKRGQLYED